MSLTTSHVIKKEQHHSVSISQVPKSKREHIYELDPLRAITAIVVVAVHAMAFTVALNQANVTGLQIQNALISSIHFTRALFMFVTAFAMVYVYSGRKFAIANFWKKRFLGVVLPYCIWSMLYVLYNAYYVGHTLLTWQQFVQTSVVDILTGNASYQLYYILLTLQFYLLLPLFLIFIQRVKDHPWLTIAIAFVVQLLLFFVDYRFVQTGSLTSITAIKVFAQYQDRIILIYPFYFILGGITAIYFQHIRAFLRRYGGWTIALLGLTTLILVGHFYWQVIIKHATVTYAISVLQPVMVVYSGAVILFGLWIVCKWTLHHDQTALPRGHHIWSLLSDASFGIYLIHSMVLYVVLTHITPTLPADWPIALRVFLTWFAAAGISATTSIIFASTPVLSRLVGHTYPSRLFPQWQARGVISVQKKAIVGKQAD